MVQQPLTPNVATVVTKWQTFLGKVSARLDEVVAETEQGVDALIARSPLDHGPIGAAFTAVQVRFKDLAQKVGDAWSKIDNELDEAFDKDDVTGDRRDAVWRAALNAGRELQDRTELTFAGLETRKQAAWARAIWALAQQEKPGTHACTNCGTPFQVQTWWQSSDVTCPSCGVLNAVHPGMATAMVFAGNGVHALAHEQAFPLWMQMWRAEEAYKKLRVGTEHDRQQSLAAARAYWTAYYTAIRAMHPGFPMSVEEGVAAKMMHYDTYDHAADKRRRALYGDVVAARGDRGRLAQLAGAGHPDWDFDDAIYALLEHGDAAGAQVVAELAYAAEGTDDPKGPWVAEKLADCRRTLGLTSG